MSKKYAIYARKSFHKTSDFTGAFNHNFRLEVTPNIDTSKSHLNRELIPLREGEKTYTQAYKRRLKEGGVKNVQKNNVLGEDIMLTYSRNAISEDDLEAWIKVNLDWLDRRFGRENIISAVLHLDESSPHIHAIVVPVLDGKLAITKMYDAIQYERTGNTKGKSLIHVQDDYAETMHKFNLERGMRYSIADNERIKFYNELNDAFERKLPEPMKGESIVDYAQRVFDDETKIQVATLKKTKALERKIVELSSMNGAETISQLTDEIKDLTTQLEEARAISEKMILDATRMRYIIKALKNDYPSAESREGDFEYLRELVQAGELFEKGYSREEVDKILSGEMEERDINKEEKEQ